MPANGRWDLTLNLLTWRIWWAPNNASRWQMRFNSAFKPSSWPVITIILRRAVSKTSKLRFAQHTKRHSNLNPSCFKRQCERGNKTGTRSVPQHIFLWAHSANHLSVRAPPPPSFKRNPILSFFLSPNQDELHVIRANNVNIHLFGGSVHRKDMNGRSWGHSSTRWPPSVCCTLQLCYWLFCKGQNATLWKALCLLRCSNFVMKSDVPSIHSVVCLTTGP